MSMFPHLVEKQRLFIMWFLSPPLSAQFLMYIDSVGSGSPMDMETDGPVLDDVNMLKKTVEEEATQVTSVP